MIFVHIKIKQKFNGQNDRSNKNLRIKMSLVFNIEVPKIVIMPEINSP